MKEQQGVLVTICKAVQQTLFLGVAAAHCQLGVLDHERSF